MNAHVNELFNEAKKLSADERIELADLLYAEAAIPDAEWEAAWAEECERRIDEYERGETVAEDFDVFMERMRQKYLSK